MSDDAPRTLDAPRPLDGIRVLELGQILAAPFAATLLGYFGAEVIKIELPSKGDPLRGWRELDDDGTSLWWRSLGRDKKSVTLDVRTEDGCRLARRLIAHCDVLIESFRPGTLEKWGLDPEALQAEHPRLVIARVSGFGQTGPDAQRPGYASVCEAVAGLRHVTGEPGERPVRANLSLGDSLTGLHAALGVLLALLERERGSQRGQVVDVAITEAVFNVLEAMVPEYHRRGVVRQPTGAALTGVVPSNTYPTVEGSWVVIGANNAANFERLMRAVERPDLAADPALAHNAGRVARQDEIDAAIAAWTGVRPLAAVLEALAAAAVPAGPINSIADISADPHFRARGLFEEVEVGGRPLEVPAMAPRLSATPGRTRRAGPDLGEHTREVLQGLLGLADAEIEDLRRRHVV